LVAQQTALTQSDKALAAVGLPADSPPRAAVSASLAVIGHELSALRQNRKEELPLHTRVDRAQKDRDRQHAKVRETSQQLAKLDTLMQRLHGRRTELTTRLAAQTAKASQLETEASALAAALAAAAASAAASGPPAAPATSRPPPLFPAPKGPVLSPRGSPRGTVSSVDGDAWDLDELMLRTPGDSASAAASPRIRAASPAPSGKAAKQARTDASPAASEGL
jgi:hypothetical protein